MDECAKEHVDAEIKRVEQRITLEVKALTDLLAFLRCTFGGGTDADAPLALALDALERDAWAAADILMVTDGELPPPAPETAAFFSDLVPLPRRT